jgi:phage terminase large subunit-like protein
MTRGQKICAFIEAHCLIPEGAQVGQSIELMKFHRKFILVVFDNLHGASCAYLSVARKNGKSALIAAILLVHDRERENFKEALLSIAAKNDNIEQALRGK